jgi:putative transposase
MTIGKELIDELMASSGGSLIGPDGLVKKLSWALVELMLAGELNHHLGYEKHEVAGYGTVNSRNGKSQKTLKGGAGEMTIEVPRDRNGTFKPKLIEKHQTRFEGFDGARYSGAPPRHVWGGCESVSDLRGDRQDSGRG